MSEPISKMKKNFGDSPARFRPLNGNEYKNFLCELRASVVKKQLNYPLRSRHGGHRDKNLFPDRETTIRKTPSR